MKKIVIFLIVGQIVASIITYAICHFLGYSALRDAVDVAFFVGAAIVFIGFPTSGISESGTSEDWFLAITGIMWAVLSYTIYYVFGR